MSASCTAGSVVHYAAFTPAQQVARNKLRVARNTQLVALV